MDMIQAYLDHLTEERCSPRTIDLRRGILTQANRELPNGLAYACAAELDAWVQQRHNANTQTTYANGLISAYSWWTRPADPWLASNPTEAMQRYRWLDDGEPRAVTEEQLADILVRATDPYRLWIVLAAYQGLRACEIAGLDREHVSRDQLIVVRGKGGAPRSHDTDPFVWDLCRVLPPGPVARKPDGRRRASAREVSRRTNYHLQQVLGYEARPDLGEEGVTIHMMRHRMGVQMQKQYRNIRVTQRALGHKSLTSTQRYTDASLDELRAARAMLPRPAAGVAAGSGGAGATRTRAPGGGSRG